MGRERCGKVNLQWYRTGCLHWQEYVPYLLIALIIGVIPAVSIRLRGELIDAAAGTANGVHGFFALLAVVIGLALLQVVCGAASRRMAERHQIRQSARLGTARLEKAARVSYPVTETERFHSLWQRTGDAPDLDNRIFRSLGDLTQLAVKVGLSLAVLWTMDAWTALGILFFLAAGVLLNRKLAQQTEGFWVRYRENMRRTDYLSSLLMQREYAAERKLFSFDGEITRRYQVSFAQARRENAKLGQGRFRIETLMQFLFAGYSVVAVVLLLRPLLGEEISIGLFTSAFYAAVGLEESCKQIYAAVLDLLTAARQLGNLSEFWALEEEPTAGENWPAGEEIRSIEFRDVSFTYPGGAKPVLEHVSFRLEPGRHYALVGENGSGKSTVVKLLIGLYRPDSGEVLVNGRPTYQLSPEARRKLYAVVFQDFYRFPLTIRENVSLGLDTPAADSVLQDLFARLDFRPKTLDRPAGLDSDLMPLHETGAGLSGGEWQKLAVARCVLSPAPIAVLDEPNAALDPVAEATVYAAYRELLKERTTLFISHRLGSVRLSDEILVLRDGALIAMAPHEQLLRECPHYAALYETQKGLYRAD